MNKTVKIIIWIVVIILVIWGITSLSKGKTQTGTETGTTSSRPIKIGAILPLTGPIANAGEYVKEGIDMAVADLEKQGKKIDISIEDYGFDSKLALSSYNRLKTTKGFDALIVFGTNGAMALSPIANTDHVPMLGLVAAANYSSPNDFTYRTVGDANLEAKFASQILVDKLGKKKIAVMYLKNDYGNGALSAFKGFIAGRATVVAEEGAAPGTVDYRSQLAKVKAAAPDAIFLATLYKEAGTIVKQAKEIGIVGPFMCGQPCDYVDFINTAGKSAAEGALVVAPTDVVSGSNDFSVRYEQKYGVPPSYIAIRSYDTVRILSAAGESCPTYSSDCLKKYLDDLKGFPGLSYPIEFDNNGDINDQFLVKVVKDGKFVPYK